MPALRWMRDTMKKDANLVLSLLIPLSLLSLGLSLGCASQNASEPDQVLAKGPIVVTAGVGGVT
jgi:hypothetical protein